MLNDKQNGNAVQDEMQARLNAMPFDKDQRAWDLAKAAAVEGESLSDLIARSQRIKETL